MARKAFSSAQSPVNKPRRTKRPVTPRGAPSFPKQPVLSQSQAPRRKQATKPVVASLKRAVSRVRPARR